VATTHRLREGGRDEATFGVPLGLILGTGEPPRLMLRSGRDIADLLIDCKEDRTLRAVLVGILREAERLGPS